MAVLKEYKIMVSILAANALGPVLRKIAVDALGLRATVGGIEEKFGKMPLLIAGIATALVAATSMAVKFDLALADAGDKIIYQQQLLRSVGVTPGMVDTVTQRAMKIAVTTPGTDPADVIELFGQLRVAIGNESEALSVLRDVAKNQVALQAAGQNVGGVGMSAILKALDLTGAGMHEGVFDPQHLAKSISALTNFLILEHGLIKPQEILSIARTGGWTAQGEEFTKWLEQLASVIMESGRQAGTGLTQLGVEFEGGKVSLRTKTMLEQYKILPPGAVKGRYGQYMFDPDKLAGHELLFDKTGKADDDSYAKWSKDYLVPHLREMGITSQAGILEALVRIIGSVRALRVAMALATPSGQILTARDTELVKIAETGTPYEDLMKTKRQAYANFEKAWDTLTQIVGRQAVAPTVEGLNLLTKSLLSLADFFRVQPHAFEFGLKAGFEPTTLQPALLAKTIWNSALGKDILAGEQVAQGFVSHMAEAGLKLAASFLSSIGKWMDAQFTFPSWKGLVPNSDSFFHGRGSIFEQGLTAVPRMAPSGAPLLVHVTGGQVAVSNGKDIGMGVSDWQTRQLNLNPTGATGHNGNRDYTAPGLGTTPGLLNPSMINP